MMLSEFSMLRRYRRIRQDTSGLSYWRNEIRRMYANLKCIDDNPSLPPPHCSIETTASYSRRGQTTAPKRFSWGNTPKISFNAWPGSASKPQNVLRLLYGSCCLVLRSKLLRRELRRDQHC
eukprot:GHVU01218939.1.p2 GENE.GHVU01218939.1~~GHVU01218939.1.p2  ORF type:complete len:121 (+),score=4.04 GHVU01218939.1:575-937(+)